MYCTLCHNYARALYDSVGTDSVSNIANEARAILAFVGGNNDFIKFATRHGISDEDRSELLSLMGDGFSQLTKNFLSLLIKNKRLVILEDILIRFIKIYDRASGKVKVKIFSCVPLTQEEINTVRSILESQYGSNLNIDNALDKSLLAGIIILVDHVRYDFSLSLALDVISGASKEVIGSFGLECN